MTLNDILQEAPANRAFILVTGPYQGGKSTFLASVCDRVWTDVQAYRSAHEPDSIYEVTIGQIFINDDSCLILIEKQGAVRDDVLVLVLETPLFKVVDGVVVIFDSSKTETFREAKSILESHVASYIGKPSVTVASFQDHPAAWTLEDLRIALGLDTSKHLVHFPYLLPCIGTSEESPKRIMLALLEMNADHHPLFDPAAAKLRAALE